MAFMDQENKKRWQRAFRRQRRSAMELGQQADEQIEKLLIRRFDRLISVRRFIFLWVSLFLVLIFITLIQIRSLSPYYQDLRPVPGGIYSEGVIGTFTNANPIYAVGTANTAVSHLVFSGLFKYDNNNKLVGDLASGWDLSKDQTFYTVHLKHNIKWHDGKPFSADDVVFTYQTIQDIGALSTLYSSWKNIKVIKVDNFTVGFDLPNPLSSFPYALTNGIVPYHLLKDIPTQQLRSADFNIAPVGTGPFEWRFIEITDPGTSTREQRISLSANDHYWAGQPRLDGFNLITFTDEGHLISAFKKKQLNAMSGLEALPDEFQHDSHIRAYATPLTSAVMAFFNTSRPILGDKTIRRALVSGTDRSQLTSLFEEPTDLASGPLLSGQLGYDPKITQLSYNLDTANKMLDDAGWTRDAHGQRSKDGQQLKLSLTSQDTVQYTTVAHFLQQQWSQLGIKTDVSYYNGEDLQSAVIGSHDYDVLLYGISIGVDPDVFAYWDSSQASITSQGHLNLSEYKSSEVDRLLQAARTRADPSDRVPKYRSFVAHWVQDAPALALYQPNFIYITRGPVFGYQRTADNSSNDRFYNVNQWMVRQQRQTVN